MKFDSHPFITPVHELDDLEREVHRKDVHEELHALVATSDRPISSRAGNLLGQRRREFAAFDQSVQPRA